MSFKEKITPLVNSKELKLCSRTGKVLQVDTSEEYCKKFGFYFLERVSTNAGRATVIGTAYRSELNQIHLHVILDKDTYYISYWDNGYSNQELIRDCKFQKINDAIPDQVKVVLLNALGITSPKDVKDIVGYDLNVSKEKIVPPSFTSSSSSSSSFYSKAFSGSSSKQEEEIYECPTCNASISGLVKLNEHLDSHQTYGKNTKLEVADSNFDFRDSPLVFQSILDPDKVENLNSNSSHTKAEGLSLLQIFEKASGYPEDAKVLKFIIPKMVSREFRTNYWNHLKPSVWEKIHATYFASKYQSLSLEESAEIFELSLELSERYGQRGLQNILAPVMLRSQNFYEAMRIANENVLEKVYQFGITKLSHVDMVKMNEDPYFQKLEDPLQAQIRKDTAEYAKNKAPPSGTVFKENPLFVDGGDAMDLYEISEEEEFEDEEFDES